jgi:polysaccharide chain length determinant protein (PEP-CTERM system associated)
MNAIYEEIRVALHIMWRRRWLALAVAWAVCVLGWLAISLIPSKYESRAKLLVKTQSLLPGKVGITENDTQRNIDHIRQTLTSRENLVKVVRNTDIARQATSKADILGLAASLSQGIKVVAQPDNVFEISAETSMGGFSDAQKAQLAHDVVERLVDLFTEGNAADDRAEAVRSIRFLDEEIGRRERGLRDAEGKRVAFEQKYLGGMPGTGSIDARADAIRTELSALEPNLSSAQSSLSALNAQVAATPATIAMPGVPGGSSRASQIEAQIADAQAKGWTDQHPDMIALRSQLARVRGAGGAVAAGGGSMNPVYMSMRSMQAEKQATASSLGARKAQLQFDLNRLTSIQIREPGIAAEQSRLSRDYEVLKDQYDKLIADREDLRLRTDVANRGDTMQVRVIDPPSRPSLPSSPNRPLLLAVVLVLGIGAGGAAAWAMGQLRTSYSTADRLACATGLTVLGSIPETLTEARIALKRQQLKWFAGAAGALGGVFLLLMTLEFVQRGLMA